jgi:hypothetical protein
MFKKVLIIVGILGVGVAVGRYLTPTKIQEREKIVYQDKIVEKKVYVKDTNKKVDKVTVKLVTILPDGTKTIETKTFDKSEIEITQNGITTKDETKTVDKSTEKVVEYQKDNTIISVAGKNTTNSLDLTYGLMVHRQVLGPLYLGAFGFADKSFGASIGIGF